MTTLKQSRKRLVFLKLQESNASKEVVEEVFIILLVIYEAHFCHREFNVLPKEICLLEDLTLEVTKNY